MSATTLDALRKAAVLIDSLDQASADALLEQMGKQQAARVRSAVLDLGDVSAAERERVIAEFLGRGRPHSQDDHPGVELEASLASKFGAHETIPPASAPSGFAAPPNKGNGPSSRPFEFLHEATPDSLAALLAREHPQTAALVLAHLAPVHSARVLETLPAAFQVDVIRRIVDLDEADPEVLREVERQIEATLSHELRAVRRRSAGMATVGAILAGAGGDGRQSILANLAGVDETLAHKLDDVTGQAAVAAVTTGRQPAAQADPIESHAPARPSRASRAEAERRSEQPSRKSGAADLRAASSPEKAEDANKLAKRANAAAARDTGDVHAAPFDFQALVELDDRSLAAVFAASQPGVVLLALTGAPQRLVQRVLKQLPGGDARALRQRLKQTGPVQLRDIERAQKQLARTAGRLAAEGEICVPAVRRFAVAA